MLKKYLAATVFKIDNDKKCFLSSKSAYYYDFWRVMWHWEWSKVELCITGI